MAQLQPQTKQIQQQITTNINKHQQTPTNNNKHQQTTQTKTHQNKETHFALTESRRVGECVIAAPPAGHGNFHSSRAVGLEGL